VSQSNPGPPTPDDVEETTLLAVAGRRALQLGLAALVAAAVLLGFAVRTQVHGDTGGLRAGLWVGSALLVAAAANGLRGLVRVAPGEAVVVQFLGRYMGSLRRPGLWWINPWAHRLRVSTKARADETPVLKVNDSEGIPIELAMVVNWRVTDTAKALFLVDDHVGFVRSQSEMALRDIAAQHCYQPTSEGRPSLSAGVRDVSVELRRDVARRVDVAGVAVLDCQLVRVAYATEIAHAMLRRQQAAAVVAARTQIVDGAVGMVELALNRLEQEHVVELDEERKATMVSNLLVVLCSDHATQPIVNTGSLYL
jgi:regulator of protease activity HflC (stomatin/prohibitin superfamily)